MDEQELNKKLAEWAGFEFLPKGSHDKFHRLEAIRYSDGCIYSTLPNFTQSLDACFKWLKPAVVAKGRANILTWRQVLTDWKRSMGVEKAMDEAPALALCLVIEELIDSET